jgi:hypothetical protein
VTRGEANRAAITLRNVFAEELEAARPGTKFETLPLCPICGTPPAPNLIAGILCIDGKGQIRDPHLVRVEAWRKSYAGAGGP